MTRVARYSELHQKEKKNRVFIELGLQQSRCMCMCSIGRDRWSWRSTPGCVQQKMLGDVLSDVPHSSKVRSKQGCTCVVA